MPFEYGFIPEGEAERYPSGCIAGENAHAIVRYDYDGSYEVVVLRPKGTEIAEVYILPQEDMKPNQTSLPVDKLTDEKRDGEVTPTLPYETHFQNADGDRATLYVNYLPIGARILYLADGSVKFTAGHSA